MNVYIKKIIVKENEKIVTSPEFSKGLTILNYTDYMLDIMFCVLGKTVAMTYNKDYKFFAEVSIGETYYMRGKKQKGSYLWDVSVYKEDEAEQSYEEYVLSFRTNTEMDNLCYFDRFKKQGYPHRIAHYKDVDNYYSDEEFKRLTEGYGTTRSFRGFVTQYIKHFKPIRLHENKELYLNLLPNGRFVVLDASNGEKVPLSAVENILYHFYSFLSLADFWARAEKIRNLNRVNKPLIVSNFLEHLDDSVDITQIKNRANRIGRQVVMFAKA